MSERRAAYVVESVAYADLATEHDEQCALFAWAERQSAAIPELALLFAVPNGGARNIVTAARLKEEGVKPGVPDLCLPVARQGCHGLFIELKKRQGGRLSHAQRVWLAWLEGQGYRAVCCHGWEQARLVLLAYLGAV